MTAVNSLKPPDPDGTGGSALLDLDRGHLVVEPAVEAGEVGRQHEGTPLQAGLGEERDLPGSTGPGPGSPPPIATCPSEPRRCAAGTRHPGGTSPRSRASTAGSIRKQGAMATARAAFGPAALSPVTLSAAGRTPAAVTRRRSPLRPAAASADTRHGETRPHIQPSKRPLNRQRSPFQGG